MRVLLGVTINLTGECANTQEWVWLVNWPIPRRRALPIERNLRRGTQQSEMAEANMVDQLANSSAI